PYVLGRTVRRHRPAWAGRLGHPLDLVRGVIVVVFLVVLIGSGKLALLRFLGEPAWVGAVVFTALAMGLGYLFGGREPAARRTLMLAANSHDLALGLTLASLAYSSLPIELPVFGIWAFTFVCNLALCEILGRPHRADAQVLAPSA